jgi:hypothetical protein
MTAKNEDTADQEYKYYFFYLFMMLSVALTIQLKRMNTFMSKDLNKIRNEVVSLLC